MSDTTRTILWIALAVVVIALVAWVMASSRRRRAAEERTFRTGELRAQPEPTDRPAAAPERPVAQETQRTGTQPTADAAPEPRATAASDADSSPAAAPAQHHDGTESDVDTPGSQHEVAAAEPDDVATAHDGHDDGPAVGVGAAEQAEQDEQAQGPERAETRGAGAAAAGAFGGASTLDHDDEPDLADADDPFSSSREPQTSAEPSQEDSTSGEQSSPNGYEKPMNETSSNAAGGHFDDGHTVSVPALDEAKEALTDGGTPSGDAGDHRGQAWSTSPGSASLDTESGTDERDAVEDIDAPNTAEQPVESARAPQPASGDSDVHADDADDTDTDSDDAADRTDDAATVDTDTDTDAADTDDTDAAADTDDADGEAVVARADEGSDDASHHTASGDEQGEATSATNAETTAEATSEGRRISGFDEVSDGGYGLGSAAPIADGAQPLGHPVKAWHDRKSFVGPDDEGYDGSEPDVWFYSADAARRAGFSGPND